MRFPSKPKRLRTGSYVIWEEEAAEWSRTAPRIGRAAAKAACTPDYYDVQANRAFLAAKFAGSLPAANRRQLEAAIVDALWRSYCDGAAAAARTPQLQRKRLAAARKSARQERYASILKVYGRTSKRLTVAQRVAATARKLGVSERTVYRALE
jgi:hypothetical protein